MTHVNYFSLINGHVGDTINITDGGLQYGHGLFETIAVRDSTPLLWSSHLQRLLQGCQVLGLPAPDATVLWQEALQLCQDHSRAVLKIIITRGTGGRGYRSPIVLQPQRILSIYPWPEHVDAGREQGVRLRYCENVLSVHPVLAQLKHLNRLEQVLAQNEWQDSTIQEGLMLNSDRHVISGTMSNLFLVKDQQVFTPDVQLSGIAGVMRATLLKCLSDLTIPYKITVIEAADIAAADEVFLSNSVIGIWPVRQIAQQKFAIGPITQTLLSHLTQDVLIS